ncbi:probable inactive receptor kinase At4g23740 [Pyrus communis]|uniref:probable inactive receptor kinase At4g23740 n=1 Tax=Pyrus communis TaxID=23211 RepID=UPI0035BF7740
MEKRLELLVVFVTGAIFLHVTADPVDDKQALFDFIHNISHSTSIKWNENSSVCKTWTGVVCSKDQSGVIELHLPGAALHGPIPPSTLSRLSALQVLNLSSNTLTGPFPSDFSKLRNLSSLCLQYNNFSGPLPLDFSVWKNLTVMNLSNNAFSGNIPSSISSLTHLTVLNLANNSLSGEIPDLNVPSLQQLDLANNNLSGNVPQSLQRFPSWAFSGNTLAFLPPALPVQPPNSKPRKKVKLGKHAMLGIVIGGCVLGFVLIAVLMIICRYNKKGENGIVEKPKKELFSKEGLSRKHDKNNRISFFEGSNLAFDLEDLLRASADVLGKGTFGTTYKAALEDATTVVVKRLKEVSVGKKEFEQQIEIVGSIRHENVAALRAYYYSKDEKLVVYDYYEQGSASSLLHAKRGDGRIPLDWETRLKMAIGAARGIAHIHTQNGGKLVHGNIKASNIFLNSQGYGCVCDVGLPTLMGPMPPPAARTGGYRAPEVKDTRKSSPASDVYSFGVLLLELLTGKSPIHTIGGEEVVHLVRWVNSVVREEWTAEVFDVELLRYPNIEEEMVEMLQIGMSCVARMPEQRPNMPDLVKRVEEIRQVNTGTRPSSGISTPILNTPTPPSEIAGPSFLPQ